MTSNVEVPTYEDDLNELLSQSIRNINGDLQVRALEIEKALDDLNKTFYDVFVQKVIGSSGPPNLGGFTPSYKPLAASTLADKRKRGVSGSAFFLKTGALRADLEALDPLDTLGRAEARVFYGGVSGNTDGSLTVVNRVSSRGKRWVQIVARQEGTGRFIRSADLKTYTEGRIRVFPFGADSLGASSDPAKFISGNQDGIYYKLRNYNGGQDRPISAPFLTWWLTTNTEQVLRRFR